VESRYPPRVLLSFLQVALTIRAIMRSVAERYVLGIVGGLARVALMGLGAVASLGQMSIVMLPGITLKSPATHDPSVLASVGLLLAGVGGPLLTFVVVWTAHRATRDIPAAQEERASRPFMAWVPVAVLDAMYLVVSIGAAAFSAVE